MFSQSISLFSVVLLVSLLCGLLIVIIRLTQKRPVIRVFGIILLFILIPTYYIFYPAVKLNRLTGYDIKTVTEEPNPSKVIGHIKPFFEDGYLSPDEFRLCKTVIGGFGMGGFINEFVAIADTTPLKNFPDYSVLEALTTFKIRMQGPTYGDIFGKLFFRDEVRAFFGLEQDERHTPQFKRVLLETLFMIPDLNYASAEKISRSIEKTTPKSLPLLYLHLFKEDIVLTCSDETFKYIGTRLNNTVETDKLLTDDESVLYTLRAKHKKLAEIKSLAVEQKQEKFSLPKVE